MLDLIVAILLLTIFWKLIIDIATKVSSESVVTKQNDSPFSNFKHFKNAINFSPVFKQIESQSNPLDDKQNEIKVQLLETRINSFEKDMDSMVKSLGNALQEINRLNSETKDVIKL